MGGAPRPRRLLLIVTLLVLASFTVLVETGTNPGAGRQLPASVDLPQPPAPPTTGSPTPVASSAKPSSPVRSPNPAPPTSVTVVPPQRPVQHLDGSTDNNPGDGAGDAGGG